MISDGTPAALIMFVAIFLLPLFLPLFRGNFPLMLIYWFVLGLHQAIAITNAYLFTTFGADLDAATFHRIGTELAGAEEFSIGIGGEFYINMLGVVYWVFGPSHLLGQQLSILAFSLSCIVLIKIVHLLGRAQYEVPILFCFGALPTMVLLGSVTMRESYQVLFFMLAVYFGLRCQISGKIRFLFGTVISALAMGLFHNGLILYAGFLITLVMTWRLRPASGLWMVSKLRLLSIVMIPLGVFGLMIALNVGPDIAGTNALKSATTGELLEYAALYREKSVTARATYGVTLDTSSWGAFIPSSLAVLFYYLFTPFPWQVGNLIDVYAFMEVLWRMTLIFYAIKEWRIAQGSLKEMFGFMLLLYFSMAFLWALGTTNYGTGMRHHMVHYWIIIVLGLPPLVDAFKTVALKTVVERHLLVE